MEVSPSDPIVELPWLLGFRGDLHGQIWSSSASGDQGHSELDAVLIAVHGLGDHSGRFETLARRVIALSQSRIAVMAFDLPAHGRSPGKPGTLTKFKPLLADIGSVRRAVRDRLGDVPQVLLGHSMGGNLAINYALRQHAFHASSSGVRSNVDPLHGLILAAPMLLPPEPLPRPLIFAAWLTGHLLPFLKFSNALDPEKLTSDPAEMEKIRSDRAMHSRITLYLATQLISQGRWAVDHARDIDVPTLVMYGEQDSMIDRGACDNVAIRIGKLASRIAWADTKHDLFHDVRREEIFAALARWLDLQLGERVSH